MKAVIFDMDGVIIDSESIHADMKIRTLTPFGIPCSMEDCVAYVGRSAKAFFTDFAKFATTPVSIQEMVDYKHRIYLEYIQESNSIYRWRFRFTLSITQRRYSCSFSFFC